MTKEELIEKLNNRQYLGDCEAFHSDADDLLLEWFATNGMEDVKEAYEKRIEDAAWWATA